ncbi:hypothetical protein Slin14017_G082570 [Septoria linicola]|nr:hypothetical protein Slin14017_G082570 [Septoria linicola]
MYEPYSTVSNVSFYQGSMMNGELRNHIDRVNKRRFGGVGILCVPTDLQLSPDSALATRDEIVWMDIIFVTGSRLGLLSFSVAKDELYSMSRMLRTATEQEAQLENVILHHQTFDVADFIASTMTTANSMAYLRIAYKAVEHISVRNNLLVSEAQRIEANIDISSHHAMRGRDFTDSMLADGDVEVLEQLSMSQRENRILDVSREVVKVRDWNRILTRSIEVKMNGKDRHQPYRNADGEQRAGGRKEVIGSSRVALAYYQS